LVYPGMSGGTNAGKSAYSPLTQLYYVPALERSGLFFSTENQPERTLEHEFNGGAVEPVRDEPHYTALRAIDPATAKVRWEYRRPPRFVYSGGMGSLLVTAGGVLFGADGSTFLALDAASGKLLRSFETGGKIRGAPVTYRVNGRQYVAVASGDLLLSFGLQDPETAVAAASSKTP